MTPRIGMLHTVGEVHPFDCTKVCNGEELADAFVIQNKIFYSPQFISIFVVFFLKKTILFFLKTTLF